MPRRCLAAFRALAGTWLVHAPLVGTLMLLTPSTPPRPQAVSGPRLEAQVQPQPLATPPQPSAAPATPTKRAPRKRLLQAKATRNESAPPSGLKVVHVGSVERPEGDLPFGFERIPERPAQRIPVGRAHGLAESLERELIH